MRGVKQEIFQQGPGYITTFSKWHKKERYQVREISNCPSISTSDKLFLFNTIGEAIKYVDYESRIRCRPFIEKVKIWEKEENNNFKGGVIE